ncbi:hypothetical protein [Nostoc sp.]|uniref:hypothetical protein n=1 Tax=Nostoc sp. TaxID=1180 RepID=UPI002FF570E9
MKIYFLIPHTQSPMTPVASPYSPWGILRRALASPKGRRGDTARTTLGSLRTYATGTARSHLYSIYVLYKKWRTQRKLLKLVTVIGCVN